ncbi:MAG: hypothetical protein LBJ22_02565 [Synergistaceae bacterium]|jgi:hypothetical protein|nr:hypothetical protein [Synergistaceae bacterium]
MKKSVWEKTFCVCAVLVLSAAAWRAWSREAYAMKALDLLEVTGTFEFFDETVTPNVVTLKVKGRNASGPIWASCVFFGEKETAIAQEDFVKRYLTRDVTLEIIKDTGEIFSGRPAKNNRVSR